MTQDHGRAPDVIILMGVAGAGKTFVGRALAEATGWPFDDGDDFHPAANVEKMARGEALTDADRAPWLAALRGLIARVLERGEHAVIACSALKHEYRKLLVPAADRGRVKFVFLDVPEAVLRERLAKRTGHFAPPELLPSQLSTLERPRDALRVDGTLPPDAIVEQVRRTLGV